MCVIDHQIFCTVFFFCIELKLLSHYFISSYDIPVMAAVVIMKKVLSIGRFSPSVYLQSLHFFLFDQINSNCMYQLHWKSAKNMIEPNELDEQRYSQLLNQKTSYAHWHAFLYLHVNDCLLLFSWLSFFLYRSFFSSFSVCLSVCEYGRSASQGEFWSMALSTG